MYFLVVLRRRTLFNIAYTIYSIFAATKLKQILVTKDMAVMAEDMVVTAEDMVDMAEDMAAMAKAFTSKNTICIYRKTCCSPRITVYKNFIIHPPSPPPPLQKRSSRQSPKFLLPN